MSGPILDIAALTIAAGSDRRLLDGVSLSVAPGEVVGVIGESGAGKSTLGLMALGFVRPGCRVVSGQVRLGGTSLLALEPAALRDVRQRRVAYVAQSAATAFNPAWRIGDQVAEIRRLRGRAESEAAFLRDLFARLDLPDPERFGRSFPHQVSGGQLQRAMLAMALAGEPDLVVLDEPTTALDVTTQLEVLRAIRAAIGDRGLAALYISHDIALVAQMTQRMLVLRHGRMVETGPTAAMIAAPREAYTRELVAARTRVDEASGRAGAAPAILAIEGVTAGYASGTAVVKDASLALPRGKVVAIVGQSGSGKSTLARVVTGLLPPRGGALRLDGAALSPDLAGRSRDQRRRIQLIHQSPDAALNPRQRVGEIIGRPLAFFFDRPRVEIEARTRALLRDTELPEDLVERAPQSLSGGQKQRVCIARALAAEPDVLICDEITSALDPLVEDSIVALLARIRAERGLAMLFITHNLALTRRFADEVVVMHQGRIVERGDSEAIFVRPREAYTRVLIAAVPTTEPGWLDRRLA
ncbi:MAG: ABC transporter ATP-binding protein [Alphaproteobacteria bacterium]|nr:ABC transporter ATP-binding protein [Alphaproteobacteria bacterium]